ncbi:Codanin-1 C-terminus [Popillia japonica]|uniref:Codanin-1 C-terminus n=1 Tax=Popillia japonica TaxID=7064 RepID=A0AAW1MCM3_POPJA
MTNSSNSSNVVKHIKPLSSVENSTDVTEKKLKVNRKDNVLWIRIKAIFNRGQLEEAFFNCQPISIRKTVEFISERVASSCVKHICNNVVPEFKKASLERAKIVLLQLGRDCEDSVKIEEQNQRVNPGISQTAPRDLYGGNRTINSNSYNHLYWGPFIRRLTTSIGVLLSVDELPQTRETCVLITKRLCRERIQQWINSHINIGLFNKFKTLHLEILKNLNSPEVGDNKPVFQLPSGLKLLHLEILKNLNSPEVGDNKPVFQLPSGGSRIEHNPDTVNAVKIVEIVKNISINLLEDKDDHLLVLRVCSNPRKKLFWRGVM